MLHSLVWVIDRLLNFVCRRFGTLCSVFIGSVSSKMEQSVLKRHKIKLRRQRITQKKEQNLIYSLKTLIL